MKNFIKYGLISLFVSNLLLANNIDNKNKVWPEVQKTDNQQDLNQGQMDIEKQEGYNNNPITVVPQSNLNEVPVVQNDINNQIPSSVAPNQITKEDNIVNNQPQIENVIAPIINNKPPVENVVQNQNNYMDSNVIKLDENKKEEFLKQRKERMEKEREMINSKNLQVNNPSNSLNNEKPLDPSSNNSLNQILKELSDIKVEMKKKEDNYSGIVNALLDGQVDTSKKEDETVKEAEKENEEIVKLMLPIPQKAINFGNKVILFAIYKEENLTKSPSNTPQQIQIPNQNVVGANQEQNSAGFKKKFNLNDIEYNDKIIKIEEGYRFGEWELSQIEMNYVVYKNLKTNEIIRKFY